MTAGEKASLAKDVADIQPRLNMLRQLASCDWWVPELREEEPLRRTLQVVHEFFRTESDPTYAPTAGFDAG
jgi:hypothetical protein